VKEEDLRGKCAESKRGLIAKGDGGKKTLPDRGGLMRGKSIAKVSKEDAEKEQEGGLLNRNFRDEQRRGANTGE